MNTMKYLAGFLKTSCTLYLSISGINPNHKDLFKSSLISFVETVSVKVISRLHTRPPVHHVFLMRICLGQGAYGHGRVNALMLQHIASLSLPFLFAFLAQRPAVEPNSNQREVLLEVSLLVSFPPGFRWKLSTNPQTLYCYCGIICKCGSGDSFKLCCAPE